MKRFRPAGASAVILALSTFPALAQVTVGAVQPMASPDADALANDMRVLGTSPNDVRVLVDAGERALRLGDDTAAGGLFTRVEKIDPNNARMKAGVGTILLHNERPGEALRYYDQAERGGADVVAFAADRGLAYDLTGDQARAQREYRRALARSSDPETTKRYALSLGITGQRDAAIRLLDPLLRNGDRSAWRAQAFVLAMTNDPKGAQKIADTMLPGAMAGGLKPFFARLPTLSPVDRAFAVNFGEVRPSPIRLADARLAPQLPALAVEPVIPATALAANNVTRATQTESRADRRRREREERAALARASSAPVQRPVQVASVTPTRVVAAPRTVTPGPAARPGFTTIEPLPATRAPAAAQTRQSVAGILDANRSIAVPTVLPQAARPASTSVMAAAVPSTQAPTIKPTQGAVVPPSSSAQVAAAVPLRVAPASTAQPVPSPSVASVTPPPLVATIGPPASTVPAPLASTTEPAGSAVVAGAAPASRETAASANASVAAHVVPTVVVPAAKPVEIAEATAKPPKPPHASRREGEDAILARIIAGISVPGSELDVAPASKQSPEPVELAALEPASRSARRRAADTQPAADEAATDTKSGTRRKKPADTTDDSGNKRKPGAKGKDADSASTGGDDGKSKKASSRKKSDEKKADEAKAAAKKEETASPSRIFVQVAGGAHEDDLGKAWDATKKKAPELFRGKQGYTTPLRATNRVLAGPFKSEDEAQAFINKLSAKGMSGFVFTSDKGQKVDKLPAKDGK